MRSNKIVHLIQSLNRGGCENMLLRLLPVMHDCEHVIITLKEAGSLAPLFLDKGIRVITVNQHNLLDIAAYRRLAKALKSEQPKGIITYLFHADMIGRLFVSPWLGYHIVPFLRTTYNHDNYRIARFCERLTKYGVAHYLANSEAVKRFYVTTFGIAPGKFTVIPNGFDIPAFRQPAPSELRSELNLPPAALVITCVANLHPNKGHRYLLEAFDQLWQTQPQTYLLVVGDGVEKDHLLAQSSELESRRHVRFLGRRSDVPELLSLTDIFVLPTLFEGMSNALLEAAASRCAIITTDIPENREAIPVARFVPIKESRSLAAALIELAENQKQRQVLGDQAYAYVAEHNSLESVAKQFSQFLERFF